MSKSNETRESYIAPAPSRAKRTRKPRGRSTESDASSTPATQQLSSSTLATKPLLVGAGVGIALALTAVALGSRSTRAPYFRSRPPMLAGTLTKIAAALVARVIARKALAAANQGARKLASSWPL